ncbi:MAG: hypothetical protein ACFCUS_03540 [Rubrimonas sp.]|uniref:hypothetical protein n=1 Tax=Rubrimonas sp. TaxID=2036015 RepID=UPI002FDD6FED
MAKDAPQEMRLGDLTDDEIERIEAFVFCMGGPPDELTAALLWKASLRRSDPLSFARAA